ncbi:CBM35 domain-containing protein [Micromonospora vulcania]|uniref:CBM35 domain-containing protein n=1 Tax=Micromonospora vulcania TaxID=1441873 RepID=A0ABW1H3K4_9ACTN
MFAHRTGRKALATLASGLLMTVVIYVGPAAAAPVRYEAENATISQGLVESNHANFSGTGFVNTDPVVGSYVEWTVNSTIAGTATFGIRFANGSTASRPADVAVNGTTVASALAFQSTGAWATWATKTVTASVNAGSNTIRVSSSAASGGPNLDYVDFEPPQSFTDYQAENALISRGVVESNWPGYTGTGFVNGDNVVGSYVEFTVSVATSGIYPVTFRHSHGSGVNRPMDISVNGAVAAPALAFPPTPTWDTWADVSLSLSLTAGSNTIRATATTANGGPNLDRLRVDRPTDVEPPTRPSNLRVVGEVRPYGVDLAWNASTDNVGVAQY